MKKAILLIAIVLMVFICYGQDVEYRNLRVYKNLRVDSMMSVHGDTLRYTTQVNRQDDTIVTKAFLDQNISGAISNEEFSNIWENVTNKTASKDALYKIITELQQLANTDTSGILNILDSLGYVTFGDTVLYLATKDDIKNFINQPTAQYNILPVTQTHNSIVYDRPMSTPNYWYHIEAWYINESGIRIANGFRTLSLTQNGFSCDLAVPDGFIKFQVADSIGIAPIQTGYNFSDTIEAHIFQRVKLDTAYVKTGTENPGEIFWDDQNQNFAFKLPSGSVNYATTTQNSAKQDTTNAVIRTNAFTSDTSIVVVDGTGRKIKQSLSSVNRFGDINIPTGRTYKINNLSILNSNLVSGSAGTAGYIFTGNGTTTTPSWSTPLTAIGSSLTQNYLTKTGATKLENSSIYESDGLVGINTTTLTNRFTVNGTSRFIGTLNLRAADENFTEFQSRIYSNTTWHGQFNSTYRARGTEASPLAVVSGNGVMHYDQLAYDGSNFIRGSQFRSYVDGTVAIGITPIGWEWLTMNTSGVYASRLRIRSSGVMEIDNNVAIGTTDLDGTPAIGRLTVKGSTNNGTSNIFVGRDSDEVNVFSVDTDGDVVASGTITASSATTNTEVINLGQLKDKVKSGSISMVTGTWPIYFEKSFPTAGYVTSVWGIDSLGSEIGINVNIQYDYGFEIDVPEDCIVKYDCTYPETPVTYDNNMWYGIEYLATASVPSAITRIGNLEMHKKLPIQNKMKGCLLADNGTVNYYLYPTDWTKKSDNITASVLDGTDGQVMVEIPVIYWKFEESGDTVRVKISEYPLPGFYRTAKNYISAYEASLNRINNKLSSVVNTTADYRGGNNTSAWDAASNSLLGKPATNISRTNFRTYARNRGNWDMNVYNVYKSVVWLFTIEYATRNSQLAVNNSLDANGYKQGGLGNGVTTLNATEWNNFNGYNPFISCGATNSLANFTGEVLVTVTDFGGIGVNRTCYANRYRGIENPFGHIWKNTDGINIKIQANNAGAESQLWIADSRASFNDSNYTGYENRGLLPRTSNYIEKMIMGAKGELMPKTLQSSNSQYWADYFYTSSPTSGEDLRTVLFGGRAGSGPGAGFGWADATFAPSDASASLGSRLCFLGN